MRKRIAAAALAATLAAVQVGAQDDPEPPVLHPFGGGFDITSLDGFVCKGCGAYAADSLPASTTLDMGSFAPEDAAAVFDEIVNRVNPRRR